MEGNTPLALSVAEETGLELRFELKGHHARTKKWTWEELSSLAMDAPLTVKLQRRKKTPAPKAPTAAPPAAPKLKLDSLAIE